MIIINILYAICCFLNLYLMFDLYRKRKDVDKDLKKAKELLKKIERIHHESTRTTE